MKSAIAGAEPIKSATRGIRLNVHDVIVIVGAELIKTAAEVFAFMFMKLLL